MPKTSVSASNNNLSMPDAGLMDIADDVIPDDLESNVDLDESFRLLIDLLNEDEAVDIDDHIPQASGSSELPYDFLDDEMKLTEEHKDRLRLASEFINYDDDKNEFPEMDTHEPTDSSSNDVPSTSQPPIKIRIKIPESYRLKTEDSDCCEINLSESKRFKLSKIIAYIYNTHSELANDRNLLLKKINEVANRKGIIIKRLSCVISRSEVLVYKNKKTGKYEALEIGFAKQTGAKNRKKREKLIFDNIRNMGASNESSSAEVARLINPKLLKAGLLPIGQAWMRNILKNDKATIEKGYVFIDAFIENIYYLLQPLIDHAAVKRMNKDKTLLSFRDIGVVASNILKNQGRNIQLSDDRLRRKISAFSKEEDLKERDAWIEENKDNELFRKLRNDLRAWFTTHKSEYPNIDLSEIGFAANDEQADLYDKVVKKQKKSKKEA